MARQARAADRAMRALLIVPVTSTACWRQTHRSSLMHTQTACRTFVAGLVLLVAGCAGFKGGWESVPYVGDAPPKLQEAQTPFDSRERTRLTFEAVTLAVTINNQVRTYDTHVYGAVVPLSIDPRTVRTHPVEPGKTRITLEVSGIGADFVFRPSLARLTVGDHVVAGIAGFEFGMWGRSGQRVSAGGDWADKPTSEPFPLQDRARTYLLSIDFPIDPPSPESRAITLDFSKALAAPGISPLPLIRFAPGRWKHGYT